MKLGFMPGRPWRTTTGPLCPFQTIQSAAPPIAHDTVSIRAQHRLFVLNQGITGRVPQNTKHPNSHSGLVA